MSLYSESSLIVYPSGYKESKIYAQKPVNGTGDLTFSRASSATRLNEQGLIETASIIGSELILSTLINSNYDTFNEASVSGFHAIYSTSGTQRASTVDEINFVNGKTYQVNVDVSVVSGSIPFLRVREAVATNPTVFSGQLVDGSNVVTFTSTSTFTGLLEFASSNASEYRVSNVSVKEVITSNIPRIDYTNGCGSLLLEKQSTNLIPYSEDFSNAAWSKTNLTITSNNAISPDGTLNASKMTDDATSGEHKIFDSLSITSGVDYTFSVFVKSNGRNFIRLRLENAGVGSGQINVWFDVLNGTVGTVGAGTAIIENYGNGWYRCIATGTTSTTSYVAQINLSNADNSVTYLGDGTSGVYLYGAQLEQSSYPTSYIISNSGTSTTRLADTASKTGLSSVINDSEGVLFAEIAALADDGTNRQLSLSDGSSANNKLSIIYTSTTNQIQAFVRASGSISFNETFTLSSATSSNKIAIKWKLNDFALWVNGTEVATDISGSVPVGLSKLSFDDADGTNIFFSNCQNLMVFPSALTDEQLTDLTGTVHTTFNSLSLSLGYTIL